ncbi:chemotaxis protein CheW [Paenibacillus sp. J5C_2022]|uniref:chemotaxis protein CheW n=1 Tax=Paenibacillus sp. J5C2022 TaxID=2977129 RepID=UPI0021D11239|nr:chemotaxis protein CheW [Paenibacillus sp. J5C2022]MCU6710630.1 chemotaxis protein CheW [Paenibacillus sp. J5C2022]
MDFHASEYMSIFLDELDEQLQHLDSGLLRLEQDCHDMDTISVIFRAAHTLKGSSAAMGFHPLKDLTHSIENVFELLRNRELTIDRGMMNVLFRSIDYIKVLKDAILNGTIHEADIKPFTEQLEQIFRGNRDSQGEQELNFREQPSEGRYEGIPLDEYERNLVLQACKNGFQVMAVSVSILSETAMKSVRALLVHNKLKELGEVIIAYPAAEQIEDEEAFDGNLVFMLATKENRSSIMDALAQVSQIQGYHITQINDHNLDQYSERPVAGGILGAAAVEAAPAISSPGRTDGEADGKKKPGQTVRVDVDRLEQLLNFVGELIIDHTRMQQFQSRFQHQFKDHEEAGMLNDIVSRFGRVISNLQDGVMKTRMLPIEHLFNRFPRVVRDAAQSVGKEVELIMEGKETELDRSLIEEIGDPIIHILRNSVDHGIENPDERECVGKTRRGRLVLKASHQENGIVITIADDGRGIDPEKVKQASIRKGFITAEEASRMSDKELVQLIFQSGLSTAERVTDLSGRGVGMDIVRSHLEKLNGVIDIDTSPGEGTAITIKLPLTLAIIRSLLVKLGGSTFAIPLVNVVEIVRLHVHEIGTVQGREVCHIRGMTCPLIRMHRRLQLTESEEHSGSGRLFVVVLGIADKRVCLVVDKMIGNQEIVIKSLGGYIGDVPYISGATILGDGNVALILDVGAIVKEEGSSYVSQHVETGDNEGGDKAHQQLVTFKLAGGQYALPIQRVKEIIPVPPVTQAVHAPPHMLGLVHLREAVLPVFDLRSYFGLPDHAHAQDRARIIVVETNRRDVGIRIDEVTEVLKVPEADMEDLPHTADGRGRSGGAVKSLYRHGEKLVMLIDIDCFLRECERP